MENHPEASVPSFVVIGYCNHDIDRYPDGRIQKNVGGGGFFASQAATLVNKHVGFVSKVGQDFDLTPLQKRNLTKAVKVITGGSTALSDHTYHDFKNLSDRSISLHPGVNPSLQPDDIPLNYLSDASGFLISTMIPEQQREFVKYLSTERAKFQGRQFTVDQVTLQKPYIAFDTDLCWLKDQKHRDVIFSSISLVDILFCNRAEGEIFHQFFAKIPLVILKKDQDGAEAYHFGKLIASCQAPRVEVVNVTGAGDVFAGVFLGMLTNKESLEKSLIFAAKMASRSISQEGIEHIFLH